MLMLYAKILNVDGEQYSSRVQLKYGKLPFYR